MGLPVDRERFTEDDFARFERKLVVCLEALRRLLARPGFGEGPPSLGAELEASIVDATGRPLAVAGDVLATLDHKSFQHELLRFNVEYNAPPLPLRGAPFAQLRHLLGDVTAALEVACNEHGGHLLLAGIPPGIRREDVTREAITPIPRYRVIVEGVERLHAAPIRLDIHGRDEALQATLDSVAVEGSNTSFQVHLRAEPPRFAATYDAAQLVTPIVLAVAANSPIFLGRVLWDETRVPLLKQTLHARSREPVEWRRAARVPFGHGWTRAGAWELFAESVALFPPLCPLVTDEDPLAVVEAGGVPALHELRLHHGTIWQWNRAIFDPADGGHLRVEMRALPSGPTRLDMVANAAFLVGLVVGLRDELDRFLPAFPFQYAEYNFYRAAQRGLDAKLLWPESPTRSPVERDAGELARSLLPVARRGLETLGVDSRDIDPHLGLIEARLRARTTPAQWFRRALAKAEPRYGRIDALAHLTRAFIEQRGLPVHEWREEA